TLPLSSSLPAPDFVIVGHGPERPNVDYSSTGFRSGRSKRVYGQPASMVPYAPLGLYTPPFPLEAPFLPGAHRVDPYSQGTLCIAQVNTQRGPGLSYVTECPAVMQRAYRPR